MVLKNGNSKIELINSLVTVQFFSLFLNEYFLFYPAASPRYIKCHGASKFEMDCPTEGMRWWLQWEESSRGGEVFLNGKNSATKSWLSCQVVQDFIFLKPKKILG